jgi:anti-anti-sigma factor
MQHAFRAWYDRLPFADSFQHTQAQLLQTTLLILASMILAAVPIMLLAASAADRVVGLVTIALLELLLVGALAVLRRGRLRLAVLLTVLSLLLLLGANMVPIGIRGSRAVFTLAAVPLVLAGLLGGRRLALVSSALLVAMVLGIAWLEQAGSGLVGFSGDVFDIRQVCLIFALGISLLALLVGRFGSAFALSLRQVRQREHELEALQSELEQQVAERTLALQRALADVQQRKAALGQTLADLQASEATVSKLSAPVIPVLPGVLVVPLIGSLDAERSTSLRSKVLGAISDLRAGSLIIDVTGVVVVDEAVAEAVLSTAAACRLLGAQVWLVGVRPEVAQTITALQIGLDDIQTQATLQEAVQALLRRDGWVQRLKV